MTKPELNITFIGGRNPKELSKNALKALNDVVEKVGILNTKDQKVLDIATKEVGKLNKNESKALMNATKEIDINMKKYFRGALPNRGEKARN